MAGGTWSGGGLSEDGCEGCKAGGFLNDDGNCKQCPEGETSTVNSVECAPCPEGEYAANGQTECEPCPGKRPQLSAYTHEVNTF